MARKLFVWDLHGTLESGNEVAVIKLSNEVLSSHGFKERFRDEDAVRLYGLKWHEYFKDLLPDAAPDVWFALQEDCFRLSQERLRVQASFMKPTPGSREVLSSIAEKHDQILISNTRLESLRLFMAQLGLARFFRSGAYYAVDGHSCEKATKIDVLERYLSTRKYSEIIVIGDSRSDMELGERVGARRILYNHPYLKRKEISADLYTSDLRTVLEQI